MPQLEILCDARLDMGNDTSRIPDGAQKQRWIPTAQQEAAAFITVLENARNGTLLL